jgi:DNA mismatch repair protein MutS2
VRADELRRRPDEKDKEPARREAKSGTHRTAAPAAPEVAIQTSSNTCDLRGLRVDEALGMTAQFLDRAFGAGERVVFLVHGHGTGALRDALRSELAANAHVASFRAGGPGEGGDGATLVWFE